MRGAARGLGRAIALALAGGGADVALCLRDAGSSAELVADAVGLGRRALLPVPSDLRDLLVVDGGWGTR